MPTDESSKRFISRLSDEELKRIFEDEPSEYTTEEMAFVREELVKRGYEIDEGTIPTDEIGRGTKNEPGPQLSQGTRPTGLKKAYSRFFSLSFPQKAGIFLLAALLIFVVIALSKYAYTEMVGEKDVNDNNDTSSEQYHVSKINGEWVTNGHYVSFYADGVKKEEGLYVNGRKDKTWLSFYENGNISTKTEYQNGLTNGKYEEYFEDGKPKLTGYYRDGEKEQRWTRFFPNQSIQIVETFSNDMANGDYQSFFAGGNLESEGSLQNDTRIGEWTFKNDHGITIQEILYWKNGSIQLEKKYSENGLMSYRIEYDSAGDVLSEDYFDQDGKNIISKFIGTWREQSTDFHSVDMISRSNGKVKIDASKRYEKSEYSYFENSQMATEGTCTTIGIFSVTPDSIIFFPQRKRHYPSRSYMPSIESRRWMDDGSREWAPDSDDAPDRLSIKEFHDTYKKY